MILLLALLAWISVFIILTYASWIRIQGSLKIYLLVLYSMVFLSGVFLFFPLLKRIH